MALRMTNYMATIWMQLAPDDLGPGGEYPFVPVCWRKWLTRARSSIGAAAAGSSKPTPPLPSRYGDCPRRATRARRRRRPQFEQIVDGLAGKLGAGLILSEEVSLGSLHV